MYRVVICYKGNKSNAGVRAGCICPSRCTDGIPMIIVFAVNHSALFLLNLPGRSKANQGH